MNIEQESNTKSVNIILSIALVVLAVLFAGYVYKNRSTSDTTAQQQDRQQQEKQQEKDSAAFTASSLKALAGNWSTDELRQFAHPKLLEGIQKSGTNMDDYFTKLKKLGALKDEGQCVFLSMAEVTTPTERFALADYGCNPVFENSKALVAMEVRQDNMTGPWKILNFKLDSPLFKPEANKAPAPAAPAPQSPAPEKGK